MLPRVLEPELMNTLEEARDYDAMDHREVNARFVAELLQQATPAERQSSKPISILDVGTGTALIPIELVRQFPIGRVTGADLAGEMLQLGLKNVITAGMGGLISLDHVDAKELPYANARFQWVISNSILHHLPEPLTGLREMFRVVRVGGLLFVRDLFRPETSEEVEHLVDTYAAGATEPQRQLFRNSLHAALTVAEVRLLVEELGLPVSAVQPTSDRHWTLAVRKTA